MKRTGHTLSEPASLAGSPPLGLHQVICPKLFVRAWVAHDTRLVTATSDHTTSTLGDLTTETVKDIGVRVDGGNEKIQLNIGGTIFSVSVT